MTKPATAAAVLLLAGWPAAARPQQPFASEAQAVSVDVAAVDGEGRPVEGLTAADFTVRVDGQPRDVALLRFVSVPAVSAVQRGPAVAAESAGWSSNAGAPNARAFLIVIDRTGLTARLLGQARAAGAAFVRGLAAGDRVGLLGIPGASPLVDLTRDKERVAAALERPLAPAGEPLADAWVSVAEAEQLTHRTTKEIERRDDAVVQRVLDRCSGLFSGRRPLLECPQLVLDEARRVEQLSRQLALQTIASLRALVESLGRLPVPKRIVLVSSGFRGSQEFSQELEAVADAAAGARVSIDVIQPSAPRSDSADRWLMPDGVDDARLLAEGLGRLAELTGGVLLRAPDHAGAAFEQLARERSGYYLLALEPRDSDRDGRRHAIDVKVSRPRVTLRARRQFVIGGPFIGGPSARLA